MAEHVMEGLELGATAPSFELRDTEGAPTTLPPPDEASATVVIWTCNHCPYALAWHERLIEAAYDYLPRGVRFFMINSNDAERYPADSPEAMAERYDPEEWSGVPYLHDPDQSIARAYGAQKTPHAFVFDSELVLRYQGAPDEDHQDPEQNAAWLRGALDAVLAGDDPEPASTQPVGCSIKWKE